MAKRIGKVRTNSSRMHNSCSEQREGRSKAVPHAFCKHFRGTAEFVRLNPNIRWLAAASRKCKDTQRARKPLSTATKAKANGAQACCQESEGSQTKPRRQVQSREKNVAICSGQGDSSSADRNAPKTINKSCEKDNASCEREIRSGCKRVSYVGHVT